MTSYLLLRSNKESGPYTLDELLSHGLKPYDLVWVKGKSAAWRYPSEVDELKPYAPPVEEQPFDRFYKKPSEAKTQEQQVQKKMEERVELIAEVKTEIKTGVKNEEQRYEPKEEAVQAINDQQMAYQPKPEKEPKPAYIPKKSVFVTLPGQKMVAATTASIPTPISQPTPTPEKKRVVEAIGDVEDAPTITIKESIKDNTVSSQIKYSQPLDEIKEMYVKTLHERKSKIARKSIAATYLKKAAVIAGLVGVGVLAGFIIKPKTAKDKLLAQQSQQSLPVSNNADKDLANKVVVDEPQTEAQTPQSAPTGEEDKAATSIEQSHRVESVIPEKNFRRPPPPSQSREIGTVLRPPTGNKETEATAEEKRQFEQKQLFAGAEKNPVTGERTRTVRDVNATTPGNNTDNAEKNTGKTTGKSVLESQVDVRSNDYKKVAFGGIRDLRLTVTNNSKYELDNVIVQLQYLKPSEQPLRTENVEFKFIGPNESSTIRIPDTNRGIKVSYKIISIGSKQSRDGVAGM